jgi:quercetin dioxygenase-like cupin family protein
MKLKLFGLALVVGLAAASPSLGAGPPIFAQPIAVGKIQATTIHASTGTAILDRITVNPGGNFGWHTHSASVAVVVTSGTLTVFDPKVAGCAPFKVTKGQSFVEPANHVHLARNDGTKPVRLYAFYLGLAKGSGANVPAAEPADCST